jgi:hypothetical protein
MMLLPNDELWCSIIKMAVDGTMDRMDSNEAKKIVVLCGLHENSNHAHEVNTDPFTKHRPKSPRLLSLARPRLRALILMLPFGLSTGQIGRSKELVVHRERQRIVVVSLLIWDAGWF